jgi:hypothetical protein
MQLSQKRVAIHYVIPNNAAMLDRIAGFLFAILD